MTNRALHLNQVVLSTVFENDRLTLTRDHSLRELVSLLMDNLNRLTKRLNHKLDLYEGIPLSPNNPSLQLTSASSKGELFLETLKFTRYIQSMKISQIQHLHPTLALLVSLVNKYRLPSPLGCHITKVIVKININAAINIATSFKRCFSAPFIFRK
ncbi:hypothetical protein [Providencia manganoxydans]|uniref:hypothetical protein n=1 Tax=Providencia manganoxydans TaxID=2923283 RepID=UPI0034E4E4E1